MVEYNIAQMKIFDLSRKVLISRDVMFIKISVKRIFSAISLTDDSSTTNDTTLIEQQNETISGQVMTTITLIKNLYMFLKNL